MSGLLQRSSSALFLSLLLATPVHAGVIRIDFTAEVINAGGPLGNQGEEQFGSITFELIDLPDQDPSADALFSDGRDGVFSETDLGFARSLTFNFTQVGRDPRRLGGSGSVTLSIVNSLDGDSLSFRFLSPRSTGLNFVLDYQFGISGTSNLFAGDEPLNGSLLDLEALLLSFDFDQATGSSFTAQEGSPRSPQSSFLEVTSMSIARVPEPSQFGMLVLGLLVISRRAFGGRVISKGQA